MTIAARLKELRERTGRSARDVSIHAKLSPGTVSDIENNPEKSPRVDSVMKLARALGVSFTYLAEGTQGNVGVKGFSESDATPWLPKRQPANDLGAEQLERQLCRLLAPDARSPTTYQIGTAMPGFSIEENDVIIVDLNSTVQPGDLVVATVADLATGAGTTILRRYLPPYLVANNAKTDQQTLVVDNHRTVIMGRVCASFRANQLSSG